MSLRRSLTIVGLAALAACASQRDTPDGDLMDVPRDSGPTRIQVENQNFADMTIYVIRSGQRYRLGTVPGHATRTFDVPPALVAGGGDLQFMADPIGGTRTPVSEVLYVAPGELIELTIPPGAS